MNFEDEVYVRLYTRDTKTWLRLGFEGQTVLSLTLRKFDRAGVLDDIDDPATDVALLIGAPVDFVRVGLGRLLERDVFRLNGSQLVMPNYIEAQTCRQSDRLRQQESRSRRRSTALEPVTKRDSESRNVTESHQPSPAVTDCHSVLSSAVLSSPSIALLSSAVLAEPGTRTLDVPDGEPHQEYLTRALMAGVSRERAEECWKYWHGKGLPSGGVRDLYGWLIGRAKLRGNNVQTPRPSGGQESRAERQNREWLEHVATLESQEVTP